MKNFKNFLASAIFFVSYFVTIAQPAVDFLGVVQFNDPSCSGGIFQPPNCGDQVYEVSVCNFDNGIKTLKVEIAIEFLTKNAAFIFTNPIDFTLNTATGKLEATVQLDGSTEDGNCTILRFRGKSLNGDPKTRLIATVSNGIEVRQDCVIVFGGNAGYTMQNTSISFATSQNGGPLSLIPMPSAAGFPQTIVVDGVLTIDQSYTFGKGSAIRLLPNASIVIKPGKKLFLDDCNLFGCDELWDGISLEATGELLIKKGRIRDAKAAVQVGGEGCTVRIEGALFEDNVIGVKISGVEGTPTLSNSFIRLDYSSFVGKYTLKNGDAKPSIGISILSDPLFTPAGVLATHCDFINHVVGINNFASNVLTRSCIFKQIEKQGIISSQGTVSSTSDEFNDIRDIGIFLYQSDATVTGNTMIDCKNISISSVKSNYLKVKDSEIDNSNTFNSEGIYANSLDDLKVEGTGIFECQYGIRLSLPKPSNKGIIENSAIYSSKPLRFGIDIKGGKGYKIKKNNLSLLGDGGNDVQGITMLNPSDYLVQGNNVDVNGYATGVFCDGGTKINIGCNTIKGDQVTSIGLGINQTGGESAYFCNTITGGQSGAYFGDACTSRFTGNIMSGQTYAELDIQSNSYIGSQVHAGNLFKSASIAKNAGDINLSQFIVSARHQSTTCLKDKERIPNTYTSPGQWFNDKCEDFGISTYQCPSNCAGIIKKTFILSDVETRIFTEDPNINSYFGEDLKHTTRKQLFGVFAEDPTSLLGNTQIVQESYNQYANSNIGNLYNVKRAINEAYNSPWNQELDSQNDTMQSLYGQINDIETQIAGLTEGHVKTELRNQERLLMVQIANTSQSMGILKENAENYKTEKIEEAKQLNNNLQVDNVMDFNERQINDVFMNTVAANTNSFSEEEFSAIAHVALQCPISGGDAVYRARVLYAMKYPDEKFDDKDACKVGNKPANRVQKNKTSGDLFVIPNPANNEFVSNFHLSDDYSSATLTLLNSLGMVVAEQKYDSSNNFVKWNTSDISNGVYILLVTSNNQVLQQKRVVVAH